PRPRGGGGRRGAGGTEAGARRQRGERGRRRAGEARARERRNGAGRGGGEADRGAAAARLERPDELIRRLEAVIRRLRHHLADDLEQGTLLVSLERRRGQLLHDVLVADRERVLPVERHVAGEALERDDAERVDVAPPVELLGTGLLRAHVVRRTDRHPQIGRGSW